MLESSIVSSTRISMYLKCFFQYIHDNHVFRSNSLQTVGKDLKNFLVLVWLVWVAFSLVYHQKIRKSKNDVNDFSKKNVFFFYWSVVYEAEMSDTDLCTHCGVIEDIPHYFLRCKKYISQRRTLYETYRKILSKHQLFHIPTLFSAKTILTADIFPVKDVDEALLATYTFIKATNRRL